MESWCPLVRCSFAHGLRSPPWLSASFRSRDETLSGSELTAKLEPAFLSGLRCAQPLIRAKFFEVFDNSMKRRVYERLLYVTCSQNWEAMGNHFWIKQCIEVGRAPLTVGARRCVCPQAQRSIRKPTLRLL